MYAVIFKAINAEQDDQYGKTVARMRELAFGKYNCQDFIAVTEGEQEIAISYWQSLDDIRAWKSDTEHTLAQETGRKHWYKSYKVEVVDILREYGSEREV